jgi:3-oxoacyl-[acyl-carrier protein] reductase
MHLDFTGRRALVTGGTRGIGAAIVDALLDAGCTVIATGTSAQRIAEAQRSAAGRDIEYVAADFSVPGEAESFAERMRLERLDVLVNNAGINRLALIGDLQMDDWDAIVRVNLRGPTLLCRALAPGMAERGYGRIVNICSIFGNVSRSQRVAYTTSKAGLLGMTRTVALDYARRNVLSNAVSPGFIATELTTTILTPAQRRELAEATPLGRLGQPAEIARAVLFLSSEENSFTTGQQLIVDGGFTSV